MVAALGGNEALGTRNFEEFSGRSVFSGSFSHLYR